ncbi:centrosome-associated protein CEP250-like [Rissa tridactyla]|uniref:centrosome-associated protein CEP250-like n=1 Tax=Rissa tridactyla TaxID=75485 RepID=UPI0023BB1497|nr:centrosome-associated protein CEP250-like [Rissa tridactyla]
MSCINEALALDKVQLNQRVLQLEQENEALLCKVDEMERAKISAQEKLSLCERTKSELCAEKAHLEQLLKKAEEQQEELRVELGVLAEEKEEHFPDHGLSLLFKLLLFGQRSPQQRRLDAVGHVFSGTLLRLN